MKLGRLAVAVLVLSSLVPAYSQAARKHASTPPGNRDQESVQAVAKLEDEMRIAALKGDAGWWAEHLSEAYIGTDFQGKISNKEQALEFQRSKDLVYDTWNLSDRAVHIFNGDTVIVTGKMTLEGTYRGQSLSGDFQFTRVWVRNGLVWELAAFQSTKLAQNSQEGSTPTEKIGTSDRWIIGRSENQTLSG